MAHFHNLILFPNAANNLICEKVGQFAGSVLVVFVPYPKVADGTAAIDEATCTMLEWLFELTFVNARCVL